jgi:hypothetical protein
MTLETNFLINFNETKNVYIFMRFYEKKFKNKKCMFPAVARILASFSAI